MLLALLALGALAAPAAEARSPLHVARVAGGLRATYVGHPAGGVVFVVDGAAVARDATAPYVLALRVLSGGRATSHRIAVRTLRTGRLLAAAVVRARGRVAAARLRSAAPPAIGLATVPDGSARTALVAWRTAPAGGALACTLDGRVPAHLPLAAVAEPPAPRPPRLHGARREPRG